jgi:hypothetical protein
VLTVRHLHALALTHTAEAFEKELGPFVLVQRPPDPIFAQVAMTLRASSTIPMAHRRRLTEQIVTMVQAFEQMWVFCTQNVAPGKELVVGRSEDCDLRVDEPSVSKYHASLRWVPPPAAPSLRDLGSTNGTFLNARAIDDSEALLGDGDALSFGDAQFLFMLARTLHAQLLSAGLPQPLGDL